MNKQAGDNPDPDHGSDASRRSTGTGISMMTDSSSRYAIESEVIFLQRHEAGESFVVAKHMARSTYYRLGMEEYQVARLLTGTRSAQEIVAELRNRGIEWKIAEVAELIGCFVSSGLASLPQGQQEYLMTSLTMSVSEVEQQRFSRESARGSETTASTPVVETPDAVRQRAPNEPEPAENLPRRHRKKNESASVDSDGQATDGCQAGIDVPDSPKQDAETEEGSPEPPSASWVDSDQPRQKSHFQDSRNSKGIWYRRLVAALSLIVCQRLSLVDGDRIARWWNARLGFVFGRKGFVAWLLLVGSGISLVVSYRRQFADELTSIFNPDLWVMLLTMWVFAKVWHELGHAIAARHNGVRVGKAGVLFFFLAPLPYVDVTDTWKLSSKWKRIQIGLGGVYIELALAAIAAWVWWFTPGTLVGHLAAQFFLVAGPGTLLVNANPLLRLDGYYVLSDLTGISNLRMHGRRQLASLINRLLMRTEPVQSLLKGWRCPFATCHAFLSVIFQCVWMTGLVVAISSWMRGLGLVVAMAAICLWCILPLAAWVRRMWHYQADTAWQLTVQRLRLFSLAALAAFALNFLMTDASPWKRRIPVVVQNRAPQIARAMADGMVKAIHVNSGQKVLPGMLLLELENPELDMQRSDLVDELAIAESKAVQYRRMSRISQAAAESGNAASLRRRIAELDEQIAGMKIVAERTGYVLNPDLLLLKGCYVKMGQELFRVMDPEQKELLASVAPADLLAYRQAAINGTPVSVRLRGGDRFRVQPTELQPRARRKVLHPTLAATSGGPIPVESSEDAASRLQALQPQMMGVIPMDSWSSGHTRDGQIGVMTITDNRSVFFRILEHLDL